MSICLKSLLKSKSKSQWIELLVFNFIRKQYENKYKGDIPQPLKYLIILYCQKFISCKLLNFIEEIEFYKLLLNQLGSYIKSFKLLHRGSDNGFSAWSYHEDCDGENNKQQIVIIKSNHGNLFGGYQSVALIATQKEMFEYIPDPKAFLYLIKSHDKNINQYCPLLFKIKPNKIHYAVGYCKRSGPIFGVGMDIQIAPIHNTSLLQTYYLDEQYEEILKIDQLCGGNDIINSCWFEWKFDLVEYEVYKVIMEK